MRHLSLVVTLADLRKPIFFAWWVQLTTATLLLFSAAIQSYDAIHGDHLAGVEWRHLHIGVPLLLASWLMSGRIIWLSWLVAMSFFSAGLITNLYAMLTGGHCSCFGSWSPPPWAMVTIDLVALAGLAITYSRASAEPINIFRRRSPPVLLTHAAAVAIASVIVWLGISTRMQHGMTATEVRGVFVDARTTDVGYVQPGQVATTQVRIVNRTSVPFVIEAITTDCGCTIAEGMDSVVAPFAVGSVPIRITVPSVPDRPLSQRIRVVLSDPEAVRTPIDIHLRGHISRFPELRIVPSVIDIGSVTAGTTVDASVLLSGPAHVLRFVPDRVALDLSFIGPTIWPKGRSQKGSLGGAKTTRSLVVAVELPEEHPTNAPLDMSVPIDLGVQTVDVRVVGWVIPPVTVSPAMILLPHTSASARDRAVSVMVRHAHGKSVKVQELHADIPVAWQVEATTPGQCRIKIWLLEGVGEEEPLLGMLTIVLEGGLGHVRAPFVVVGQ